MVKKKANPIKGPKKRTLTGESWVAEDVKVFTGLPPKVDGQLRCFCKMSVNQVLWSAVSPPATHVRLKWWGEDGEGSVFRPLDIKKGSKASAQTTARYPVRSGPRQFASYLSDMGSLGLEVFTSETASQVVGMVQIPQIGSLSNNRPINGFFPIISPKDQKIGELQVSVVLEPLMASYDDQGSVPTPDVNMDPRHSQDSVLPSAARPRPHSQHPVKPQEDPFISPASHLTEDLRQQQSGMRTYNTSDIKQRLNYGMNSYGHGYPVAITANGDVVGMSDIQGNGVPVVNWREAPAAGASQPQSGGSDDLLSVLLSRGNNLRQRMVISSLSRSEEEEQHNNSMQAEALGVKTAPVKATFSLGAGVTLDNLLGDGGSSPADMLLGSPVGKRDWQMLRMLNGASPGMSQCSDAVDAMDVISEPGDPLHDQTILQELFYKHSASEMSDLSGLSGDEEVPLHRSQSSGSLQDPGNARPPSRSSSFSSLAAALPATGEAQGKRRKRKLKSKSASSSPRSVRQSRSKEKVPRTTTDKAKTKKSKSRSRSRSGSRSGSRSKSRSLSRKRKGSLSERSDSDVPSTPRSETSRVSFDPVPSDAEEVDQDADSRGRNQVDGLTVERLTLLGRVHVARVNILSLHLNGSDLDLPSSSKTSVKLKRAGKPPRPVKNRKPCTYLIEYQFPVVATSRDKYSPNAMATEVMRVASKSINSGVISFGHRSVFPLMFDGAALEKWWKSALIFKVYAREAGQQTPVLLGSCGVPLKTILKSDDLNLSRDLEIRDVSRNSSLNSSRSGSLNGSLRSASNAPLFGTLKVSVELASDHKDFHTVLARTRVAEMNSNGQNIVPIVPSAPAPVPRLALPPHSPSRDRKSSKAQHGAKLQEHSSGESPSASQPAASSSYPSSIVKEYSEFQKPVFHTSIAQSAANSFPSSSHETLTLHTLLMIPEGCSISVHGVPPLHMASRYPTLLQQQPALLAASGSATRDQLTRNTYLVCRMFWTNDSVRSDVCWGTLNPQYNFQQVAPVLVTPSLLERMRNNYMVIEVWDKKTSSENDKLIGIVKLSLHQFFMSFRDQKIAGALLRSEYPVVAIDNYMPIVDPFSGLHYGQICVLLAMGSANQVSCLQRLKVSGERSSSGLQRPQHFLERQDVYSKDPSSLKVESSGTSVEHIFEVVIQGVRGLKLLESMIWGEADCFVQYYFPTQGRPQQQGPTVVYTLPSMRSYRTATTLCIPDPTFHDVTRHKVILPVSTPVQRELLTACANSSGGGGGLPFEVWCRFYHPNVRDQVIARGTLPLAKLCAMVTMQRRGESSVQSFSLPLTPVASDSQDAEGQAKMKDAGLIDVTINYKTQTVEVQSEASLSQPLNGSQVCISVGVIRAAGLKAAAELASRLDSGMQYPAEVGVNAYVRARLSFIGKQDERVTKTVARTFSPEFTHHLEFPVQLLWSGNHDDPGCLAQLLEAGQAQFEVWHQVPGLFPGAHEFECDEVTGGKKAVQKMGDVQLGTCVVPLAALLSRQSGVRGWFSVNRPNTSWARADAADSETSNAASSRMVGGLELSVNFAHTNDRQRVVDTARSVGWSPVDPLVEEREWRFEEEGQQDHHQVLVNVDQVSVPLSRVLLTGQTTLDPSARCYVRYKFYDRAAVVSRTARLHGEGENLQAVVRHRHTMVLPHTAPFQLYLREELLEVQVWVTYGSRDKGQRPLQRDKLVGTAYVDLQPLGNTQRRQHRISGLLPLFKPGVASLAGAFAQLHVTSNLSRRNQILDDEDDVVENGHLSGDVSDADYDSSDSFHQLAGGARSPSKSCSAGKIAAVSVDPQMVFTVRLSVERALHLPTVRPSGSSTEVPPTTYISYQTAGRATPTHSDIVPSSADPVWDHAAEVLLSRELLTQENKNLVLKVWHKPDGTGKHPDKSSDRVLGFVSVDLCPLASGLRQICGWYNIVDFTGQSRGQIKVSITPVDLAPTSSAAATGGPSLSFVSSRGGSFCAPNDPVPGFSFLPMSLPSFSRLPVSSADGSKQPAMSLPSHWQPRFPAPNSAGGDASKSMLFSSLRQQLRDLDSMTSRLRLRLSCGEDSDIDANQPASARSADVLTGTQSGLSTIHTNSSFNATREVISDTSRNNNASLLGSREITPDTSRRGNGASSEENLSGNVQDSGAFSGDNTTKSHEAPDSQRSEKQVVFGATVVEGSSLLSGLPPSGVSSALLAQTAASIAEAQYLLQSVSQVAPHTPRSPRDFSSNSQTSQGFLAAPSDASTSGSSRPKVPFLNNLTADDNEVEEEEGTPRSNVQPGSRMEKADADLQDYLQSRAQDSDSDDNSQADEMFGSYHRYRAMLDEEEAEKQDEEEHYDDDDDGNEETITPRRINDVSGMLRQFAQHPGTLPPIFSGAGPMSGQQVDSFFLQTWPNLSQQGRGLQHDAERRREAERREGQRSVEKDDDQDGEIEEIGTQRKRSVEQDREWDEDEIEEIETQQIQTHEAGGVQDRNSFVDSWLEESAEHDYDTMTGPNPGTLRSQTLTGHGLLLRTQATPVEPFVCEAGDSDDADGVEGDSLESTPRASKSQEEDGEHAEERAAVPNMHLLSNVEFIDTLTSVNSDLHRRTQRRTERQSGLSGFRQTDGSDGHVKGLELPAGDGPHDLHLLSNVELYSTVSSYHPAAHQPRHLLSNVELASTASGSSHHPDSASSRPSRQSSANSAGRQPELEICEEEEEDVADEDDRHHQQPASARSDEVANFFARETVPFARPGRVVNGGGYDSSEDEDFEFQFSAGARAATIKSRGPATKPRNVSHSLACASDRTTTEDSGLESGAKSSQDERDGMSLLDSTQGHVSHHGAAAAVPEFFPPVDQLQASMRALQLATIAAQDEKASRTAGKVKASSDLVSRLKAGKAAAKLNGTVSIKGKQLPTAEEAKRIAKIFSSNVP